GLGLRFLAQPRRELGGVGRCIAAARRFGVEQGGGWVVRMRAWFSETRRTDIDTAIRALRSKAPPPIPVKRWEIRGVLASLCDGARRPSSAMSSASASRTSGRSESNMPTRYDLDEHGKIRPDPEDFDAVRETPDDPLKSSAENAAYKYQLAQARKLIRLYEFGQLPIELMREMEKLAEQSRGGRPRS